MSRAPVCPKIAQIAALTSEMHLIFLVAILFNSHLTYFTPTIFEQIGYFKIVYQTGSSLP